MKLKFEITNVKTGLKKCVVIFFLKKCLLFLSSQYRIRDKTAVTFKVGSHLDIRRDKKR